MGEPISCSAREGLVKSVEGIALQLEGLQEWLASGTETICDAVIMQHLSQAESSLRLAIRGLNQGSRDCPTEITPTIQWQAETPLELGSTAKTTMTRSERGELLSRFNQSRRKLTDSGISAEHDSIVTE